MSHVWLIFRRNNHSCLYCAIYVSAIWNSKFLTVYITAHFTQYTIKQTLSSSSSSPVAAATIPYPYQLQQLQWYIIIIVIIIIINQYICISPGHVASDIIFLGKMTTVPIHTLSVSGTEIWAKYYLPAKCPIGVLTRYFMCFFGSSQARLPMSVITIVGWMALTRIWKKIMLIFRTTAL